MYSFPSDWNAKCIRVRNGWRICLRMCVSVFVCVTWLRRITASFFSTFIA